MASPSPEFRIGPGKLITLCLLFFLAYGVALAVFLPAGWAWRWAQSDIRLPPGLQVGQVVGTLWRGQAILHYDGLPVQVDWRLQPEELVSGRLPVHWVLATTRSRLSGAVVWRLPRGLSLNARGSLYMGDFSRWVRQQGGAQLAGAVDVNGLSLQWSRGQWQQASGSAHWGGGLVTWPMQGRQQQATMPAMQANLSLQGQSLDLRVSKAGSSAAASQVRLSPNGMVELIVYRRLLDLAGQSWPASVPPGAAVFKMRQRLLPAKG